MAIQRLAAFPRPRNLEERAEFKERVLADRDAKSRYTEGQLLALIESEWSRAKAESLVSVTTSQGQFLMFGRLNYA